MRPDNRALFCVKCDPSVFYDPQFFLRGSVGRLSLALCLYFCAGRQRCVLVRGVASPRAQQNPVNVCHAIVETPRPLRLFDGLLVVNTVPAFTLCALFRIYISLISLHICKERYLCISAKKNICSLVWAPTSKGGVESFKHENIFKPLKGLK